MPLLGDVIEINIDVEDAKRIMRALDRVEARVKSLVREWIPRTLAANYLNTLVTSIYGQRYKSPHPYHPAYDLWKRTYFPQSYAKQGILKGDFVQNLRMWKVGIDYMVGIPAGVTDSGGKSWLGKGDYGPSKPIAMYMRVREWGGYFGRGGKHPARPLFTPALEDFEKEVAPMILNRGLRSIANAWR